MQFFQGIQERVRNSHCKQAISVRATEILLHFTPFFQDGLLGCITKKVPVLLSSGSVKLVVIDSIAAHFRSDYEGHEMYKRAKHIGSIGTTLHQFSQQYNIPIVCINQVSLYGHSLNLELSVLERMG